jgi:hypothetical protein
MSAEEIGWILAVGFAVVFVAGVAFVAYYLWRSR